MSHIIVIIEDNSEIKEWFRNYFNHLLESNYIFYLDNLDQIENITFNEDTPFFINKKYGIKFQIPTHYLIQYEYNPKTKKPNFILYIKSSICKMEDIHEQIKNHLNLNHKIVLSDPKFQIVIPIKEILYIERIKRYSLIKTETQIIQTRTTFKELSSKLNSNFVQCHRSYIVNLQEVQQYFHHEFCLSNGEIIPISRNFSKLVEERWKHYILFYQKIRFL